MKHRTPEQRSADDKRIIAMRDRGLSCGIVAERLGLPEHIVWQTMGRTGSAGKYKTKTYRVRTNTTAMRRLVHEYGEVSIEAGLNGGYVVTIGGEATGGECKELASAVRSAVGKLRGVEK